MGFVLWLLYCFVSGCIVGWVNSQLNLGAIGVIISSILLGLFNVYLGSLIDYNLLPK